MERRSFFLVCLLVMWVLGSAYASLQEIRTVTDLLGVNDPNGEYVLMNDIDCSSVSNFDPLFAVTVIENSSGWTQYGSGGFQGSFNGNGFSILNLRINRGGEGKTIGFFGCVRGGQIENLNLVSASVTGNHSTGALVGALIGGSIDNCHVKNQSFVSGGSHVGGLVGDSNTNSGSIRRSSFKGSVYGSGKNVGGVLGRGYQSGDIELCCFNGEVRGVGDNVGGIVGYNGQSLISECLVEGAFVKGGNYAGGIMGAGSSGVVVVNSYMKGRVEANDWVGGIAGKTDIINGVGAVRNCYVQSKVVALGGGFYGGVIGEHQSGTLVNNYWDWEFSGLSEGRDCNRGNVSGIDSKTTLEMYDENSYVGFDFNLWLLNVTPDLKNRGDHPYVAVTNLDQLQAMKDNLEGSYYLANNIDAMATNWWNGGFEPIGDEDTPFRGILAGCKHRIYSFTIKRGASDNVGLFGKIDGGTVSRLTTINFHVIGNNNVGSVAGSVVNGFLFDIYCGDGGVATGLGSKVGGVVGDLKDFEAVQFVSARVTVRGRNEIGGLFGAVDNTNSASVLENCFFWGGVECEASNGTNVGGLVGHAVNLGIRRTFAKAELINADEASGGFIGTMEGGFCHDCFSRGVVSGSYLVGGFVGDYVGANLEVPNFKRVYVSSESILGENYSFAGGFVGRHSGDIEAERVYWNYESFGLPPQESVAFVLPKSNQEMRTKGTYEGFDFDLADNTWEWVGASDNNGIPELNNPLNPFMPISSINELQDIRFNLKGSYYLVNDIDASGFSFEPIGSKSSPFMGAFYGNGCVITNLNIDASSCDDAGLFGAVVEGHVDGVQVDNAQVKGKNRVGVVSGYTLSATFNRCVVTNAIVSGNSRVGGMFGEIYNGKGVFKSKCLNTSVTGQSETGGLVGRIWDGFLNHVDECLFTGSVKGSGASVGGMAGYNKSGKFNSCAVIVESVSGVNQVGGFVGDTYESAGFRDCYVQASNIEGFSSTGGFVGELDSKDDGVYRCYSIANFSNNSSNLPGGFIGNYVKTKQMIDNYWSVWGPNIYESTQSGPVDGVNYLPYDDMLHRASFPNWKFEDDPNDPLDKVIWFILEGETLPYLGMEVSEDGNSFIFEDFEGDVPHFTVVGNTVAEVSEENSFNGQSSIKIITSNSGYNGGVVLESSAVAGYVDLIRERNDTIKFGVFNGSGHSLCGVKVRLYDTGDYSINPAVIDVVTKGKSNHWSLIEVNFSQIPGNFNLKQATRVGVLFEFPGTFFLDEFRVMEADKKYQSFNNDHMMTSWADYSLGPNTNPNPVLSTDGEPVHEGSNSIKITARNSYNCFCFPPQTDIFNWEWHGDLTYRSYETGMYKTNKYRWFAFWIYSIPDNQMEYTVEVKFYDHGNHDGNNGREPVKIWTHEAAKYREWSLLVVDLSKLPGTFNLEDMDKVGINLLWPGTYYVDDMKWLKTLPEWNRDDVNSKNISFSSDRSKVLYKTYASDQYSISESNIFRTAFVNYIDPAKQLKPMRYRVKIKEMPTINNPFPYESEFSDELVFFPEQVVLKKADLEQGLWRWDAVPFAQAYQVERLNPQTMETTVVFTGCSGEEMDSQVCAPEYKNLYRIRGVIDFNDDLTPRTVGLWSPYLRYEGGEAMFFKTNGSFVCQDNGSGASVQFKGINLGSWFINEAWMTGMDSADDHTIREILNNRFSGDGGESIMDVFRDAYIQEMDLDQIASLGLNVVRVPLYYRNFQDDNGQPEMIAEESFRYVDQLVEWCRDRGIFIILDLHGAYGAQNSWEHSGKRDWNQLLYSPVGSVYRENNKKLWRQIARRYKNCTTILGYDLLNEPWGFNNFGQSGADFRVVWEHYNELYNAVRFEEDGISPNDNNHIIFVEGLPDGRQLPDPGPEHDENYVWDNVVYEVHFYTGKEISGNWVMLNKYELYDWGNSYGLYGNVNSILQEHQSQLPAKFTEAFHQVPFFMGEFNGMGTYQGWKYIIEELNNPERKWGWTSWSYKIRDSASSWGLFSHAYLKEVPNIAGDDLSSLKAKLNQYKTQGYFQPNDRLQDIIRMGVNGFPKKRKGTGAGVDTSLGSLELVFDKQGLVPEENLRIEVKVRGDNLYGIEGRIQVDSDRLEIVSVSYGYYFPEDERLEIDPKIDSQNGIIQLAYSLKHPSPPVSGEGVFAVIECRARANTYGMARVNGSLLLSDEEGRMVTSALDDGLIMIDDAIHDLYSNKTISGYIYDPDAALVEGVEMMLELNGHFYKTYTNENGWFSFSNIRELQEGELIEVSGVKGNQFIDRLVVNEVKEDQEGQELYLIDGDLNRDKVVDIADFTLLAGSFGKMRGDKGFSSKADITRDDRVDIFDLSILGRNWGKRQ